MLEREHMNYTEQQIMEIESLGISIEQFDSILTAFNTAFGIWYTEVMEAIRNMCESLSDTFQELKELIYSVTDDIKTVEVKQQYKIVKRLGNENYCVYLNNKKIYRTRNNI